MKSDNKSLSRNYNAAELELFCQNRFYGPLIVALNMSRPPYYLSTFSIQDHEDIQIANKNMQNKSIKDD